jgi:tetratricopeptide (TPR) repeat protein
MKSGSRWLLVFTLLCLFLFPLLTQAQAQSYATELDLGVTAYKNARYEEAMRHFRKATELDPAKPEAHLYLATTCTGQYIRGVDTPDNTLLAEQAIEQYQQVLDSDAGRDSKLSSSKGVAYLYLNMKKWDDAKTYYQKASGFDPNDPEPYYSIGVIDWTACYQPRMEARAKLDMKPGEHLDPTISAQKRVCDELKIKNTSSIEEGIDNLNKAIQLRPDYDDAMAYLNLMYREKADLECDNLAARAEDLQTADEWVDKTLAVKKAKAQKSKVLAAPPLRTYMPTAPNPQ